MLIDFSKMEEKCNPHFKGGEKEYYAKMFIDDSNKIMRGRLEPGASIGYHEHTDDEEIIFVLSGNGTMINDDGECAVNAGQAHYCPKGRSHSLVNTGTEDLIFYAVVARVL